MQCSTKIGPSLSRQQNTFQMAFHWRVDDGQTLNAGLVPVLLKKPYVLYFSGGPACSQIIVCN